MPEENNTTQSSLDNGKKRTTPEFLLHLLGEELVEPALDVCIGDGVLHLIEYIYKLAKGENRSYSRGLTKQ